MLLMTASLPDDRLQAIKSVLLRRGIELPQIPAAPLDSELWPRYHRQGPVDRRDPLPGIRADIESLADKAKVLWVCNTVDRAIAAADNAFDLAPIIYHSRFRYEDRVTQHKRVVAAFEPCRNGPVLACCTQVAEMSLDLKGVTLLVTELAPVPALIQRLGRLNRQANKTSPTCPFLVTDVGENHLPYRATELDSAQSGLPVLGTVTFRRTICRRHGSKAILVRQRSPSRRLGSMEVP